MDDDEVTRLLLSPEPDARQWRASVDFATWARLVREHHQRHSMRDLITLERRFAEEAQQGQDEDNTAGT